MDFGELCRYRIHKDKYDFYFDFIDNEKELGLDDIEMEKYPYFQRLLQALNQYEEEKTKNLQEIDKYIHTIKGLEKELEQKDKQIKDMIYYNNLSHFRLSDDGLILTVKDGEEWLDTNTATVEDYIDKMNQLVDANRGLIRQRSEQAYEISRLARPKITRIQHKDGEEFLMTLEEYEKFKEWQPSCTKENLTITYDKPSSTLSHIDVYSRYKKQIKKTNEGGLGANGTDKSGLYHNT